MIEAYLQKFGEGSTSAGMVKVVRYCSKIGGLAHEYIHVPFFTNPIDKCNTVHSAAVVLVFTKHLSSQPNSSFVRKRILA